MATKSALAQLTLERMGVLDPEETAEAADSQSVQNEYDRLYQELLIDDLVNWTSTENIPTWAESIMADILAFRLADDFSIPEQKTQKLLIKSQDADKRLKRLLQPTYAPASDHVYY